MTLENAIKSFADAMKNASEIIAKENPNFLIAPMMGSVPLVDAMYTTDLNFDPDIVFYMPASSHVPNINSVISDWMDNFLDANVTPDYPIKIMTIDEVVSGSSATRVNRAIGRAIDKKNRDIMGGLIRSFWTTNTNEFEDAAAYLDKLTDHNYELFFINLIKNQKEGVYQRSPELLNTDNNKVKEIVTEKFKNHVSYKGIGVEDSKNGLYKTRQRNLQYNQIVNEGRIISVPVDTILTMDHPDLCPVSYQHLEGASKDNHVRFTPLVDTNPKITPKYEELLKKISAYTNGREPPHIVSTKRAIFSSDYLSPRFGGIYRV